jgi:hypothetical protein
MPPGRGLFRRLVTSEEDGVPERPCRGCSTQAVGTSRENPFPTRGMVHSRRRTWAAMTASSSVGITQAATRLAEVVIRGP